MSIWLSKEQLKKLSSAENSLAASPVPTQMISNGEFTPLPQTEQQMKTTLKK